MANEELKEKIALEKQSIESIAQKLKLLEEETKLTEDLEEQLKLNEQIRQNEITLSKKILEDTQIKINNLLTIKAAGQQITADQEKELKALLAQKKEHQQIVSLMEDQAAAQQDAVDAIGSFFRLTLGVKKESETLVHKFNLIANDSVALRETWTNIVKTTREYVNAASIAESLGRKILESTIAVAKAQDQSVSSLNKLVGTTGEYTDLVTDLAIENRRFAASMMDAGETTGALVTQIASFTQENAATQKSIATTALQLDKLGIDATVTARNMNIATRSLGMTAAQGVELQKELFATATALRMPPGAVAEAFAQAAPKLAQHGGRMVEIFEGLAVQAKETGLEINTLLGIVGQFDTFEGAADAAGKLNAILGGDLLNSVDLLVASEDERIKMLQQSIELSGRQFGEMSRFEKMAIANAAGIQDMAEATALFNPQMIGMTAEEIKNAKAKQDLAARAKHVTTMMDQLNAVMASFAVIVTPIISLIKTLMDGFLAINDVLGVTIGGFKVGLGTAIMFVVGVTLIALKVLGLLNAAGLIPLATTGPAAEAGATAAANGIRAIGTAATQGAIGFLAFGASILLVGAGIAVAALGVAEMAKAFALMDPVQILASAFAIGVFMGGLVAMALVMTTLAPAMGIGVGIMLAFGAAMVLVGAGVALAAVGMSALVDSLGNMNPAQILATTAAMTALSASMIGLGAIALIGPLVIPVALAIGAAFMMIGSAISGVVEKMTEFNNSLVNISFDSVVSGYTRIAQQIKNIVDNIENLPLTKAMTFTYLMGAPVMAAVPAGAVEAPAAAPALRATPIAAATGAERSVERLAAASERRAAAGVTPPPGGAPAGSPPQVVVKPNIRLEIDRREIGRVLDPEIRQRINTNNQVIGGRAIMSPTE